MKKNYLFLTKDGFIYDKDSKEINNIQLLGSGMGKDILEAFQDFKYNQTHLSKFNFKDILAVEYVGEFITNLEL